MHLAAPSPQTLTPRPKTGIPVDFGVSRNAIVGLIGSRFVERFFPSQGDIGAA